MPELPEVESLRRNLAKVLPGKKIIKAKVLREKSFLDLPAKKDLLIGQTFLGIQRRAKIIDAPLSNEQHLLIHLKMTGQLIYVDPSGQRSGGGHPTADWVNDLPSKHTRVVFDLLAENGRVSKLFFNDMRVFGWLRLRSGKAWQAEFNNYGPDVNDPNLNLDYLMAQASRRHIPIKQFIMTNQVIAGVGNIYASEALFKAKISPLRPAKSITQTEMKRLLAEMQAIIAWAIELGGTTFDGHYVGADGLEGAFQNELQVYGKEGEPCPRCGSQHPIQRQKLAGRSTFYCLNCQH